MGYQLEKAQGRLTNIRKVKPILGALRTISLGSWQMARNRRSGLARYSERLLELLPIILPRVVGESRGLRLRKPRPAARREKAGQLVTLVVGSERGLVGRYNKVLVDQLRAHLDELGPDVDVRLMALGSRLARELSLGGLRPTWTQGLSITALPPYRLAYSLVSEWLRQYEAYELDAVDLVYNADAGAGSYKPVVTRLIPPALPEQALASARGDAGLSRPSEDVIVETDPVQLYVRIVEQLTAIAAYRLLLEAAVTEHSARFQLMESATQNADDLVDDLMLTVQSARRQAITREMQELAIGSGLLQDTEGGR
jgi:F-type H+-transporting ATPase subunit gamma